MRLFLVVQNEGKQKGMRIPVPGDIFVVGRDPECQLRPASSIISKKHCAFINQGNEYFLEDYKSTNGTILNGQRIEGKVALKSGDNVAIGPLEFSILVEPKPAAQMGDSKSGMVKAMTPPAATAPAAAAAPAASPATRPSGTQPALAPKPTVAPKPAAKPQPAPAPVPAVSATAPTEVMAAATTAAAPTASASKNALDDDIAALLLGGEESSSGSQEVTGEGTTVVDLSKDLTATPPSGNPAIRPATAGKPISSTTDAAKALLEKYMRRPRAT